MRIKAINALVLLAVLTSCRSTEVKPNPYWGECTMNINGIPEVFEPYCYAYDNKFKLHLDGYRGTEFLRYELTFGNLDKRIYSVDSFESFTGNNQIEYATFYTFLSDGDVFGNSYNVLMNCPNHFEIDQFDESKMEFTGKFSIEFVVDPMDKNDPLAPDTIHIQNGEFKARL